MGGTAGHRTTLIGEMIIKINIKTAADKCFHLLLMLSFRIAN